MRLHDLHFKLISSAARQRASLTCIATSLLFLAACSGGARAAHRQRTRAAEKAHGTLDLRFAAPTADTVIPSALFPLTFGGIGGDYDDG